MNKVSQFDKRVAKNIVKIRKKLNVSVEEIAEFLYIDASFIRSVECFDKNII